MTKATQILEVTLENPNGVLRDYTPEEVERRREIFGGQAGFFRKSCRRKIVAVSI